MNASPTAQKIPDLLPRSGNKEARKKVLHVGCGAPSPQKLHAAFRGNGWQEIRFDIDPAVKPDIQGDMTDLAMIRGGEMDAIWSSHNVEHLFAHQVPKALGEFFRVLRDGGFALITLPDLQAVAEHIARGNLEGALYQSPAGPITALDIAYGHIASVARGNEFMAHKTGFTAITLGNRLKKAGFSNIQVRRDGLDLWALAYKLPKNFKGREERIVILDPAMGSSGMPDELDRPPTPVKQPAAPQKQAKK